MIKNGKYMLDIVSLNVLPIFAFNCLLSGCIVAQSIFHGMILHLNIDIYNHTSVAVRI